MPIIDVTHPAFALELLGGADYHDWMARSVAEMQRFDRLAAPVRKLLMWWLARHSRLIRDLRGGARDGFLSGMNTYSMKLGPKLLNGPYCSRIDQRMAASMPTVSVRVRLQETAQRLAARLLAPLERRQGVPLAFVNIAGGPCMDTLNALLLLNRDARERISGRAIEIFVFDLVAEGPVFGVRALDALTANGGPLAGLTATMRHFPHDWADTHEFGRHLDELGLQAKIVAASSEGGLFNYADDRVVRENLEQLHRHTPEDSVIVGTLTPAELPSPPFDVGIPLVPRTLSGFGRTVAGAGWELCGHFDYGTARVIELRKSGAVSTP